MPVARGGADLDADLMGFEGMAGHPILRVGDRPSFRAAKKNDRIATGNPGIHFALMIHKAGFRLDQEQCTRRFGSAKSKPKVMPGADHKVSRRQFAQARPAGLPGAMTAAAKMCAG